MRTRVRTTRSGANLFMNTLRKLGFIKDNVGLQIICSLGSVVLHEKRATVAHRKPVFCGLPKNLPAAFSASA